MPEYKSPGPDAQGPLRCRLEPAAGTCVLHARPVALSAEERRGWRTVRVRSRLERQFLDLRAALRAGPGNAIGRSEHLARTAASPEGVSITLIHRGATNTWHFTIAILRIRSN